MSLLQETITVERDIRDVYRYLLDFSTSEQWDPGVHRARKITPGRPEPGSQFELELNAAGRRVPMRYQIRKVQENKVIELSGQGAQFAVRDRIELSSPAPGRCRIEYRAEIVFSGPLSRVDGLLEPWLNRVGRQAMQGLRRALSDPEPPLKVSLKDRCRSQSLLPAMRQFTAAGYQAMPNKGLSQSMDGKTVIVTGPSSGLGLATACQLSRQGARVILLGRDPARMQDCQQRIMDFSGAPAEQLPLYIADLSESEQLEAIARDILEQEDQIDVLINNAGALFSQRELSGDGVEKTLAINLLAPYSLTQALLPRLRESQARVINVLSGGLYLQGLDLDDLAYQKRRFDGAKAYAQAKRALLSLNDHWARDPANAGMSFHAMHPGWAATPGVKKSLPGFYQKLQQHLRDSRMGADTICWLASSRALNPAHNGRFWFDRRPQPRAVLPGTAVSPSQQRALLNWLEENRPTGHRPRVSNRDHSKSAQQSLKNGLR